MTKLEELEERITTLETETMALLELVTQLLQAEAARRNPTRVGKVAVAKA